MNHITKIERPLWDRIGDAMRAASIASVTVFSEGGYAVHLRGGGWGTGPDMQQAIEEAQADAETRVAA